MAVKKLDTLGLRCPQPIHAIITCMHETSPGDILEVTADCPTFAEDVRRWCERSGKTLLAITGNGAAQMAQIQV